MHLFSLQVLVLVYFSFFFLWLGSFFFLLFCLFVPDPSCYLSLCLFCDSHCATSVLFHFKFACQGMEKNGGVYRGTARLWRGGGGGHSQRGLGFMLHVIGAGLPLFCRCLYKLPPASLYFLLFYFYGRWSVIVIALEWPVLLTFAFLIPSGTSRGGSSIVLGGFIAWLGGCNNRRYSSLPS